MKFIAERPGQVDEALNKLPPFLDGYPAICAYLAQGDIEAAWGIAFQCAHGAKILKPELLKLYETREIMRNWRNDETRKDVNARGQHGKRL